jgi:hypothetical protein
MTFAQWLSLVNTHVPRPFDLLAQASEKLVTWPRFLQFWSLVKSSLAPSAVFAEFLSNIRGPYFFLQASL